MLKIVSVWKFLENMFKLLNDSLKDIWPLAIYFTIFLFTITILGREWFAHKLKFNDKW